MAKEGRRKGEERGEGQRGGWDERATKPGRKDGELGIFLKGGGLAEAKKEGSPEVELPWYEINNCFGIIRRRRWPS